jgi:hypothetical protein
MAVLADDDVIVHGNVAMLTIALVIRTSAASGSSEGGCAPDYLSHNINWCA